MRTPRAIILAFSLLLLLVVIGHTMGRLIYARTFISAGAHFGYTSLFEVVLIAAFVVLCAAARNGPAPASHWIGPAKLALCGLLLFGAGFHLVGGEQQNLAAQLGVSGPLMAQATFYDDAGHWVFATVVSCLMALMGYQEVIDPARPTLTSWQRRIIVAEGFLLAAGASLSVIVAQAALVYVLFCAAGLLLLAWRRPLRSPLGACTSTFFAFSLILVAAWHLLPASARDRVLAAYVP